MESVRPFVGDISQLASARMVELKDGVEAGVRAIDVRITGGIHAMVLADRGMDIGPAWYGGHPLAWQSPTGIVHPAYFRDDVWLRSFHGGLLFTAGLQNVGNQVMDGGELHGLHGRISNLPATNVSVATVEDEAGIAVVVSGDVRETTVYGVTLVLHRTLRFPLNTPVIELRDRVENLGFEPAPVFILYHVNLGYPVVDANSRLFGPPAEVVGWDEVSRQAESDNDRFVSPTRGFPVQVFEHRITADAGQRVRIGVVNETYGPTGGIGVAVDFDRSELPRLWQWRMLGQGLYVTGLEPSNCGLLGRVAEQESTGLTPLEPGKSRTYGVTITAALGSATGNLAKAG